MNPHGQPGLSSHFLGAAFCFGRLVVHAVMDPVRGGYRHPWRRGGVLLLLVPALGLLQIFHWIGFLLDELLFRGYRATSIVEPVFIVGPPRSGTTHLHRVLATDRERFTTFPTWELFLAPSVTQKRFLRALVVLDRRLGAPGARLVAWAERRWLGTFDATHPSALAEPEEDFFVLLMTLRCSALFLLFPGWDHPWRIAVATPSEHGGEPDRSLQFYRICLKKHLFAAPAGRQLLSKNASFSAWLPSLREAFPDARIICTDRPPEAAVLSMLSCADTTRAAVAARTRDDVFYRQLTAVMRRHYQVLADDLPRVPENQRFRVAEEQLRVGLAETISALYGNFGWPLTSSFRDEVARQDEAARRYQSPHRYDPDASAFMNPGRVGDFPRMILKDIGPSGSSRAPGRMLPAPVSPVLAAKQR